MKLRTRFITLIAGTFVVPILVSIIVMLLVAPEFVTLGRNMHEGMRDFFEHIDEVSSQEELESYVDRISERVFVILLDDENQVVYRDDGSYMKEKNQQLFLDEKTMHSVLSERVVFNDGRTYTILYGTSFVPQFRSYLELIIIGSVLIFLAVLSALTLRSINRAITKLDAGAKRIAQGDLDTPMVLKGDDTFKELAKSFDAMRVQVKEEYDRRNRFFMGVSHDLKTPLSSITGYSQALLDGLAEDEEERTRYIRIIDAKGKKLRQRIDQLMRYIKLTNKDFQSDLNFRMLVPFLEDFIDLQRDEAELSGLQFKAEIQIHEDEVVNFDKDLLSRAMENLVQNSFRYGDTSKPIRLHCYYKDDSIRIAISNHHKSPIPAEVMQHLFEPFYRGDQSRSGEGFGLGLASVKSIVESHGWDIQADSLEREGITIFQIIIPRHHAEKRELPAD